MLVVKIHEVAYKVATEWKDISIQKACDVLAVPLPKTLKNLYDAYYLDKGTTEEKEAKIDVITFGITDAEGNKEFPTFYKTMIHLLSDIPLEVLNQTDIISIRTLYYSYIQRLIEGIHYFPVQFDPSPIASFHLNDIEYVLPYDKEIFGKRVPMINVSALEFTESADLMTAASQLNKKDYSKLPMLIAILCRTEGEPYDENKAIERSELFKELSMDIVWKIFFSLATPLNMLLQLDQISLLQQAIKDPVT